ncbi:uncharacterized protein LOC123708154 [Pieris brassicae]|uniref:uncharacterized protein LOC123708154 n=1 Tax=Pieris brassicae TaxID=7116 RepID=UPI001E65E25F|nr:uncharacterized protein LOC123708154 [Pieris brassicae]
MLHTCINNRTRTKNNVETTILNGHYTRFNIELYSSSTMIVLLLIASVATITAATNEEATSHTHINPEYLKPREEYYKPILYHPIREHESGRYHNNYFGHYAGDYNGHYRNNKGYPYSPYLEREINTEQIYGNPILGHKEPYYIPHNPSHYIPNHKYGYIKAKGSYHNVSPFVERKVDSYPYNLGYGNDGLYYSHSRARYPIH